MDIVEPVKNSAWELIELPVGRKIIPNRWVFQKKRNTNGTVARHKRLVARGFSQYGGLWWNFSLVVRFDTIRMIISVAANENLVMAQIYVKNMFFNGLVEEEIYMQQPEGGV